MEKLRLQIHQSGIEMAGKCGEMFRFRYIEGIKIKPSSYILVGKSVDKSATSDLQNKIDKGELLLESEISDIARQTVHDEAQKEEIALDAEEKSMGMAKVIDLAVDKSVRLGKCHHGEVAPQIKPTQVDRKFSINLDGFLRDRAKQLYEQAEHTHNNYYKKILKSQGRSLNALAKKGVDFVGAWDIQALTESGKTEIRDTKTTKKTPSKNKDTGTYDIIDESEQLSAYALSAHVLDGELPEVVTLDYLIDLKTEPKSLTIRSVRTMADVEQFLKRIINLIHAMHQGIFIPTNPSMSWWCSPKYCGYHSGNGGPCVYSKNPKTSLPAPAPLIQINY